MSRVVPPPWPRPARSVTFRASRRGRADHQPGAVTPKPSRRRIGALASLRGLIRRSNDNCDIDLELGPACITPGEQRIAIARLSAPGRRRVQGIVQRAVESLSGTDPRPTSKTGRNRIPRRHSHRRSACTSTSSLPPTGPTGRTKPWRRAWSLRELEGPVTVPTVQVPFRCRATGQYSQPLCGRGV